MQRLIEGIGANSPEEYNRIFLARKEKGIDPLDLKRWERMLKFYRGGRLIDIGCLDSLIPHLARSSHPMAEIWAIDTARDAIDELAKEFRTIKYLCADAYDTKFPSNYFGYVTAGEIMEHLDNPQAFLKESFRILKRGGTFVLSVPEDEAREIGAKDKDRHVWSFTVDDIKDLLEPYGKVTTKTMGSQYFPKYIYSWPNIIAYCQKV